MLNHPFFRGDFSIKVIHSLHLHIIIINNIIETGEVELLNLKNNNKKMDKKILVKNISEGTMRPVWFPTDWQEVIKKRAEKEGLPIYKYLMMLSNNYQISQNEKKQQN